MWKGFPQRLCEKTGCPGLLYDRLGYGRSSPLFGTLTLHYMHDYALCELPRVLEAVIPDIPFVLIGHSDGGSIGLIFASERSALLKGIITEAAHVFVDPVTITGIKNASLAWKNGRLKGLLQYHGEKTETTFKAWTETWLTTWFRSWSIEYVLPGVNAPLLGIQGTDDPYGTLDQLNAIVSKPSGSTQKNIIQNCGHSPHLEAEQTVLEIMAGFINGLI
jgi:pimeloyl-ACP methyl ester carboxylesterase